MRRTIMSLLAPERFIPRDFAFEFDTFIRHFDRYLQCVKLLKKTGKGEKWLDCACGTGYGTNFLSNFTNFVIGYDIDINVVEYARKYYKNNHCDFVHNIANLKKEFDVAISIETIEHMTVDKAHEFLGAINSLLKDDGYLVITTPIVRETNHNPINKHHFIEYSDTHFRKLLTSENFIILETKFIETTFTDGETKFQGYYMCAKENYIP